MSLYRQVHESPDSLSAGRGGSRDFKQPCPQPVSQAGQCEKYRASLGPGSQSHSAVALVCPDSAFSHPSDNNEFI